MNIISEWFVEAANLCCGNFDYGEDEMELSGLTPVPSHKVRWVLFWGAEVGLTPISVRLCDDSCRAVGFVPWCPSLTTAGLAMLLPSPGNTGVPVV